MNQRELFEKIYNNEITENEVIVQQHKKYEEDIDYILNDERDFWEYNGSDTISLSFFKKDEDYEYEIISKDEFIRITDEEERQKKIDELKKELSRLEKEEKFSITVKGINLL